MSNLNVEYRSNNCLDDFNENFSNSSLFSDVLDSWMEHKSACVKGSTLLKYESLLEKHIKPDLGIYRLSEINRSKIETFLYNKQNTKSDKTTQVLSDRYIKTMLIIIQSAYLYATSKSININPTILQNNSTSNSKSRSVLKEETISLLENCCNQNKTDVSIAIMLGSQAGLRPGEICALKWCDIDMINKILYVRNSVVRIKNDDSIKNKSKLVIGKPKTNTSYRLIPITDKLYKFLSYFNTYDLDKFVLTGSSNFISPRTLEYKFQKFLETCNVEKFNFHVLRHTFATRCIEKSVEFKALSEMLGHADIKTTLDIYVHLTINGKRKQLEKLNS